MELTSSQKLALDHITHYARTHKKEAKVTIQHILQMSNISEDPFLRAVKQLKTRAKIALHFHPDRPDQRMESVAQALLEQGYYKNQFETLLSNGE